MLTIQAETRAIPTLFTAMNVNTKNNPLKTLKKDTLHIFNYTTADTKPYTPKITTGVCTMDEKDYGYEQGHKAKWAEESARIRHELERLSTATAEIARRRAVLVSQRKAAWEEYISACRDAKLTGSVQHEKLQNLRDAVENFASHLRNVQAIYNAHRAHRDQWQRETGIMDETHPDLAMLNARLRTMLNEELKPAKKRLQLAQDRLARLEVSAFALDETGMPVVDFQ